MKKNTDTDAAIAEFLANGGVIQQAAYRESGKVEGVTTSPWGTGRRTTKAVKDNLPPDDSIEDDE